MTDTETLLRIDRVLVGATCWGAELDIRYRVLVHAEHSSSAGGVAVGTACGFVLELRGGETVYIAGDTDVFSDMRLIAQVYRPTLAVLPIGGVMTMGPRQAAVAFGLLGRPAVLPYHWGSAVLPGTPDLLRRILSAEDAGHILSVAPGEPVHLPTVAGRH